MFDKLISRMKVCHGFGFLVSMRGESSVWLLKSCVCLCVSVCACVSVLVPCGNGTRAPESNLTHCEVTVYCLY